MPGEGGGCASAKDLFCHRAKQRRGLLFVWIGETKKYSPRASHLLRSLMTIAHTASFFNSFLNRISLHVPCTGTTFALDGTGARERGNRSASHVRAYI